MGIGYWVSRLVYVAARLGLADYLADGPKSAADLAEATQTHAPSLHRAEPPGGASIFDFSRFGTVVDVGGGTGNLMAAILDRHSGVRGTLCELPHVVKAARTALEARGLGDRVAVASIDFFKEVPPG